MSSSVILIALAVFLMVATGLFSGAETGIYQLSRLRLRLGVEKKRLSFITLGKIMDDSEGLLISILIGTNLSFYLITSIVTLLLLGKVQSEHTAELVATLVTAPVLFVCCDVIPKNIFFHRADSLMPCVAPLLLVFKKIFTWCGVVPLVKKLSHGFGRLGGGRVSSSEAAMNTVRQSYIRAIVRETQEEEILSSTQTDILNRLASISQLGVRSVMTALGKSEMGEVDSDRAVLFDKLKKSVFTRLPVYEHQVTNIVGFINIYDCLSSEEEFDNLLEFIKPIRKFDASTSVIDAINIMQSEDEKIVLVTRTGHLGKERAIGIVTMKDLVEELVGELAEW